MKAAQLFSMLLACCGLFSILPGCGKGQQQTGPAQDPSVVVTTITPQRLALTTVLSGRTSAHLVSEVRPQVGGIIKSRAFREGSDVKAGQLLYQIDPATFQAAFENARAALAKAEANAAAARLKAQRYANLVKANGVSKQDNDDAQAAYQQDKADVQACKAALDTARINLGYTRVIAPISGRIGKSNVTPGALVTASQATALATIQQIDPIYVDVTQSSAEVLRLKRDLASGKLQRDGADGAKVKLLFDDGTAYGQEGTLQFSDITVDQTTGVITLRALFPNPGHDLLPGLYVRAVLEEGVNDQALLVPQQSLSRDSKGNAQVMVVRPDNVVEVRPITVDRVVGDKWLVTDGIKAGERVIIEGLQKVKPGMKVKATEAAAPAAPANQVDQANATANATAPAPAAAQAKTPAAKPAAVKAAEKPAAKPQVKSTAKPAEKPVEGKTTAKTKVEAKPASKTTAKPAATGEGKTARKSVARGEAKAETKAVTKAETKAAINSADKGAAYSPPKNQPWPSSTAARQ